MATIKLRPKQIAALSVLQQQRQQINVALQKLNQEEATVIELILEEKGIEGEVSNLKLEEGVLSFDVKEPKKNKKAKMEAVTE